MHLEYDKATRDANVYVIPACGFDCIPIDMGIVFLQQNFEDRIRISRFVAFQRNTNDYEKLYPKRLPDVKPELKHSINLLFQPHDITYSNVEASGAQWFRCWIRSWATGGKCKTISRLDLVIFGATGFTGKHAVQELCRLSKKHTGLTWAVAGRNKTKLEDILDELSKKTNEDLSSVKIIVADVQDEKSLKEMCSQCKVVVNCCGPYRHYGEPVVKAAIDSKTHYVDVSAEPQFILRMHLEYDKAARDANVYVIPACGFGSIPIDMGVVFLQQNFGGTLNSVESYLTTYPPADMKRNGFVNYGTWESLIYSLNHFREISTITTKLYPKRLPDFKPKLKHRFVIHKKDNAWSLPYLAADASIVDRTQRYFYETEHRRPVQVKTYVKLPNLLATLAIAFAAVAMFLMSISSCTINFVLRNPSLFTFGAVNKKSKAPSEQAINAAEFKFELYGEGWEAGSDLDSPPNKQMIAQVSGVNPAYGATVVALLNSAITILQEKHNMPQCGVLTTGVAYRNTNIIKRLNESNLKFQIVND